MEAPNNTYPDTRTEAPTPPPASPPATTKKTIIKIGILVVIAGVLLALLMNPGVRAWLSSLTGVGLNERAVLVKAQDDAGAVSFYEARNGKLVPARIPEGVNAYAEREGTAAGFTGSALVRIDGNNQESVWSDPEPKDGLVISPDGVAVAFASQASNGNWYVKETNLSTGETAIMGEGFRPQYLMRNSRTFVAFTTTSGLSMVDRADGTLIETPITGGMTQAHAASIAENGSYLTLPSLATGRHTLYRINGVSDRLMIGAVRILPEEVTSVAFRGGALYAISTTEAGQELLVYSSPESEEVTKTVPLPAGMIYTLVP